MSTRADEAAGHFGLIGPKGAPYEIEAFAADLDRYTADIRVELDMLGAWSAELERTLAPRTLGVYRLTSPEIAQLEAIAVGLPRVYARLARAIVRDGPVRSWVLRGIPDYEHGLLRTFLPLERALSTLRADVVFDPTGRARIIEVNTDNVGGIEDIYQSLRFYGRAHAESAIQALVRVGLERLEVSLLRHVREHSKASGGPGDPKVAVLHMDRAECLYCARYLAELLWQAGVDAFPARPEHCSRDDSGRLQIQRSLGGSRKVDTEGVDVVVRRWLAFEMFEDGRRRPEVGAVLDAAREGDAVVLSGFADRALFPKELLALACAAVAGEGELAKLAQRVGFDADELEFIAEFFVETELWEPVPEGSVVKQGDSFGGHGVQLAGPRWQRFVRQPRVESPIVQAPYRPEPGAAIRVETLHSVHGAIVHCDPGGAGRLAGVMSRVGPSPIVNWSQGAQVLAGVW